MVGEGSEVGRNVGRENVQEQEGDRILGILEESDGWKVVFGFSNKDVFDQFFGIGMFI